MLAGAIAAMLAMTGIAISTPCFAPQTECDGVCCAMNAGCDTLPTVSDRVKCCGEYCWGAPYLDCVNYVIGGSESSEGEAVDQLNRSCDIIENFNPVLVLTGQRKDSIDFFVACAMSRVESVSRLAWARADESALLSALLPRNAKRPPHTEQGGLRSLSRAHEVPGFVSTLL